MHHINNGTFWLKGHVCTFIECIYTVFNILLIKPDSDETIRIMHHYQKEIKDDMCTKSFKVYSWVTLEFKLYLKKLFYRLW